MSVLPPFWPCFERLTPSLKSKRLYQSHTLHCGTLDIDTEVNQLITKQPKGLFMVVLFKQPIDTISIQAKHDPYPAPLRWHRQQQEARGGFQIEAL